MLGGTGITNSAKIAILNANYIAHRLSGHYKLRYTNPKGRVAHELLLDLAEFEPTTGLKVMDFAKRLQVRSLCQTLDQPRLETWTDLASVRLSCRTLEFTHRHVRGR
jgi:glycine cleavage system protein P-like pyridoxal-binding family